MKSILKLSALAILLTVTSCAHHGKCHGNKDRSQCSMKDGKKECCKDKEQCAPALPLVWWRSFEIFLFNYH